MNTEYKIIFEEDSSIPPKENDFLEFEEKVKKYLKLGFKLHGELELIFRGTDFIGRGEKTFLKQVLIKIN